MKYKKSMIIIMLAIFLFAIAAVSASDMNDTAIDSEDAGQLSQSDEIITADEDNLEASFDEDLETKSTVVITNSTFNDYFTNGELNENVGEGSTLDFRGTFTGVNYKVNITKQVNIISSTKDALFNDIGKKDLTGGCFHISRGGSGTTLSDIKFINSAFYVTGASDVVIDDIYMMADITGVGQSTGFMCIQASSHVTVKNSYFENRGTGSNIIIIGYSDYCLIDSNEVVINGSSGNAIYITTYVPARYSGNAPTGNRIANNHVHGPAQTYCMPLVVGGNENIIDNNRIDYNGANGISVQSFSTVYNNIYTNNVLTGGCAFVAGKNSQVSNNSVDGTMGAGSNSVMRNNKMNSLSLSESNVVVNNNRIGCEINLDNGASNTTLTGNVIYKINVKSNNNTIQKNILENNEEYAIDLFTTTGNEVSFNNLFSSNFTGDAAVKAGDNNNVHDNSAVDSYLSFNDVVLNYGSSIDIDVITKGAKGITAKIGDKNVDADNFKIKISGLNPGTYTLTVTTIPDNKYNSVTKTATITVMIKTQINVQAISVAYNANKKLVVTLKDGKGNPLGGKKISVKLNGVKKLTTNRKGQVKLSTKGLAPKTYRVEISFKGDELYLKSDKHVKVTVKKANPKLIAKKKTFKKSNKVKYSITLKSGKNPIKKAKVTLKIKKKTFKAKTNKKGKATFKIKKLKKGKYKAKIVFKGNKYYDKVTKKVRITVK